MRRYLLSIITLIVCAVAGWMYLRSLRAEKDIFILYSSDVQENYSGYDFHTRDTADYSLANFATMVREYRQSFGKERCLVLDGGCRTHGTPACVYYQCIDTVSQPLAFRTERCVGYDGVGIGWSERDNPEYLAPYRHDPDRQPMIICSNLVNTESNQPAFRPYQIFERDGVRVAVLAFTEEYQGRHAPTDPWSKVAERDILESLRRWIPEVLRQNPDLIVGMFHTDTLTTEMASPFDVILMGGSDNPSTYSIRSFDNHHVHVIVPPKNMSKAGLVRIHLTPRSFRPFRREYDRVINAMLANMVQYDKDEKLISVVNPAQDSILAWIDTPIGYLGDTLYGTEGVYGDDRYRRLMHYVQLTCSGADISMASVLIPDHDIPTGPLCMRDTYRIYPYGNYMQSFYMTLEEVRRYLEYGYGNQYVTIHHRGENPLALRYDRLGHVMRNKDGDPLLRVSPVYYTSAGGIRYTVDLTKPVGSRVHLESFVNPSLPFKADTLYRVCVNSFQANDGGCFFSKALGWDRETYIARRLPSSNREIRASIYSMVTQRDTLRVPSQSTWRIIPEDLCNFSQIRHDFKLVWE